MKLTTLLTSFVASAVLWTAVPGVANGEQSAAVQAEMTRLRSASAAQRDEVLALPGVNSVGVGVSHDDPNRVVIVVDVQQATSELRARIASVLGSLPYEVVEGPPYEAL